MAKIVIDTEDMISRKQVKEYLIEELKKAQTQEEKIVYAKIIDMLKFFSHITTEKTGNWIIDRVNYGNCGLSPYAWFAYCHCSECGKKERFQQSVYDKNLRQIKARVDVTHTWSYEKGEKDILFRIYNKCPCCGADMENEVTEEPIDKEKWERIRQSNLRLKTLGVL